MSATAFPRPPSLPRPARSAWLPPRGAALALAALLCGTGARAADGCTLSGGEPWLELQTRNFVLDAAGWTGDPARLVETFEQLHAAVLASLIAEPVEIPGRVRVILLPRERDLVDYTGSASVLGLFWATPLGEPTILTSVDQIGDLPQILAHELAHHVSFYLFPRQPYWFAEGLAQFVESVAKVDREGRRWAGGDPMGGWVAGAVKMPHMRNLVLGPGFELFTEPYVTSWVLYRFLWNERGRQLAAFQQRLMDGDDPEDAWTAAFPEWSIPDGKINLLDNEISRYQRSGLGYRWQVKPGKVDGTFTARKAPLGDLHVTLLALRLRHANSLLSGRLRRAALEEAGREDAGNPLVGAELARSRGAALLPALREIAAARPDDGRGWYLLGLEATDPAEREAALRRAVALWPEGALAQAALAAHLAATGRARAALPFANRAVDLAPWSATAVSTLAGVALELSKCKEALALQARALETVESHRVGSLDADSAALRARLAAMRKRCASGAGR